MRYVSLFSGVGGLDRGLDMAGMTCVAQVEIDPFCRKILEKHWPHVPKWGDITKVHGRDLPDADLIAGGFPCTDVSQAGKRTGLTHADGTPTRSGLWFEFARLIRECRPKYALIENVPGLLNGKYDELPADRCLCGWINRWRGMYRDSNPERENSYEDVLLRPDRRGNDGKGADTPRRDESGIWRACKAVPQTNEKMGGGLCVAPDGYSSRKNVEADLSIPAAQSGTGAAVFGFSGDARLTARNPWRTWWQTEMDGRGEETGGNNPADDSGTESQGTGDSAGTGVVCQGCGRVLPDAASRPVFTSWLSRVLEDLSGCGYVCQWLCLRASEFGASHLRKRVFLIATLAHSTQRGRRIVRQPSGSDGFINGHGEDLADTEHQRCGISSEAHHDNGHHASRYDPDGCDPVVADANGRQREQCRGTGANSVDAGNGLPGSGLPAFAPGPSDARWPYILAVRPDLAPALANAKRKHDGGRAAGHPDQRRDGAEGEIRQSSGAGIAGDAGDGAAPTESTIRQLADGLRSDMDRALELAMKDRTKRLSRLGNAVVPACAQWLGERLLEFDRGR